MIEYLILSLFPGIDLLGRGFEAEGYCVVRGPDLLWGGDVRAFRCPPHRFDGVIGGSPCPDFSSLRRSPPTGQGLEMLGEFVRVVGEAAPSWWLLENVPGVPDVSVTDYEVQRIDLRGGEVGLRQQRLRHFQFGYRDGGPVVIDRRVTVAPTEPAVTASGQTRRGWAEFCALMGTEPIDLPGMTREARYRAVGNGVPVPMARLLARAILDRWDHQGVRLCACGCARPVTGKHQLANAACRKRMQRRRDLAGGDASMQVTTRAVTVEGADDA